MSEPEVAIEHIKNIAPQLLMDVTPLTCKISRPEKTMVRMLVAEEDFYSYV